MSHKETLEKAYGNIPKEIGSPSGVVFFSIDEAYRPLRYFLLKVKRFFTR